MNGKEVFLIGKNKLLNFYLFFLTLVFSSTSCLTRAPVPEKQTPRFSLDKPTNIYELARKKPLTPDELNDELSDAGHRWFFGPGFGRTALNVGTVVVFPPYAIYLVGNAALEMFGYQPLHVTRVLPENIRKETDSVYSAFTSMPGRLNSLLFDQDFRGEDIEGKKDSEGKNFKISKDDKSDFKQLYLRFNPVNKTKLIDFKDLKNVKDN